MGLDDVQKSLIIRVCDQKSEEQQRKLEDQSTERVFQNMQNWKKRQDQEQRGLLLEPEREEDFVVWIPVCSGQRE